MSPTPLPGGGNVTQTHTLNTCIHNNKSFISAFQQKAVLVRMIAQLILKGLKIMMYNVDRNIYDDVLTV